jgi:uncharacterized protein (TIGR00369 family)
MSAENSKRLAEMQKRMLDKGFGTMLGAKLQAIEEGYCRMVLPWREELSRGDALIHGGVTAALIDKAGTTAAWSYLDIPENARGSTVAMNVNFLEGAVSDLIAEARTVRRGGSISVIDVDVKNIDGVMVAKGMVTYKISKIRINM